MFLPEFFSQFKKGESFWVSFLLSSDTLRQIKQSLNLLRFAGEAKINKSGFFISPSALDFENCCIHFKQLMHFSTRIACFLFLFAISALITDITNHVSINCDVPWSHGIRIEKEEISKVALIWYMRYDMIYVRIWLDISSLLCFMEREGGLSSSSCNLIYFVHLRKIPFPIFRFLFLFRFLFRLWMAGFRTLKLHGNKMDFLQTTICEVSGNVSWTGKDDLEPGSVDLHHLYPEERIQLSRQQSRIYWSKFNLCLHITSCL